MTTSSENWAQLKAVLIATGFILTLSMGVRHGFGFWLQPISKAQGWTRETYSLAIAFQNLMWGVFGPLAGMAADRFGTKRVVIIGAILYAVGLVWMATVTQPVLFVLGIGILIGGGLACTGFSAISGIIARIAPQKKRSWAFGVAGAASSFGQFFMMPIEQQMINFAGWQEALFVLAFLILLVMIPMALRLSEPPVASSTEPQQSISQSIKEAISNRSFKFLVAGYFVCGFQVIFINVHLPSYLKDKGITDPTVAVIALALIGLFNIFGSFAAGSLGGRFPKKYLLSGIYGLRVLIVSAFLLFPLSPMSVYLFASAMGFLWLSTVPLTNGVIAGIFGVRYLSMLSGFVYLSHQVGSFVGVWLGGMLFTRQNNYDTMWAIVIGLSVFATLINLPINEKKLIRPVAVPV